MIYKQKLQELMINLRIACYSAGYPAFEACYASTKDYQKETGVNFWRAARQLINRES